MGFQQRQLSSSPETLNLHLHPKQWKAFLTPATEVLYGGAAGGGKSHLMRVAAIVWCSAICGLQVYIFRRIRDDLHKNHMEGPKGFRALLAPWVMAGWCEIVEDEIRFWNGSKIYLCHCKDDKDIYKYQGAEIHVLIMDELTHFTEVMYRFLRNRVRMVGIRLPLDYIGRFPRIMCSANPGNIGHLWVKQTFVLNGEPYTIRLMPADEGGMKRQFIPALLDDNPSMSEDDPGYEQRLEGLGSKELVKAMRWGDWNVVEGAFFDCWSHLNIIKPFAIPKEWLRFRSGDWGSFSPFAFNWWAVVQDDYAINDDYVEQDANTIRLDKKVILPRGALICYREWYGSTNPEQGDKGLKLTAESVAAGIVEREKSDEKLTYGVLDPSTFREDGGPSIAERMNLELIRAKLISFRPADNTRVVTQGSQDRRGAMGGWDQMRARMIGTGGRPMLYWFSTCMASIRTIPILQHDRDRPEDLDTTGVDHAADSVRYACMSRPWLKEKPEPEQPKDAYRPISDDTEIESFKTM